MATRVEWMSCAPLLASAWFQRCFTWCWVTELNDLPQASKLHNQNIILVRIKQFLHFSSILNANARQLSVLKGDPGSTASIADVLPVVLSGLYSMIVAFLVVVVSTKPYSFAEVMARYASPGHPSRYLHSFGRRPKILDGSIWVAQYNAHFFTVRHMWALFCYATFMKRPWKRDNFFSRDNKEHDLYTVHNGIIKYNFKKKSQRSEYPLPKSCWHWSEKNARMLTNRFDNIRWRSTTMKIWLHTVFLQLSGFDVSSYVTNDT